MQKCPGATLWYYFSYIISRHDNLIYYSRGHLSCLVIATGIGTWIASLIFGSLTRLIIDENSETSWILRFIYTILGYATVFLPCWVLIHLSQKHNLHSLGTVYFIFHSTLIILKSKSNIINYFYSRWISVEASQTFTYWKHFRNNHFWPWFRTINQNHSASEDWTCAFFIS